MLYSQWNVASMWPVPTHVLALRTTLIQHHIELGHFGCRWWILSMKETLDTPGCALVSSNNNSNNLPAFSGLTWRSLAVLQCSCTRDWNENKAEWLLSDVWYMTCNGMFPELPLHMAAYSPPDLDWTASENYSELFLFETACVGVACYIRTLLNWWK